MQHPQYLFTFLLSSALKWGQINFRIKNQRIFKPYDACFVMPCKCFLLRAGLYQNRCDRTVLKKVLSTPKTKEFPLKQIFR